MERAGVAVSSDLRSAFIRPPAWVAEAAVAQIFPDRFRRSGRVAAQQGLALQPWGDPPTRTGFQGGDLYGVIEGLDHLQALGITASISPRSSVRRPITAITPTTTSRWIPYLAVIKPLMRWWRS
jgi:hypothetical protein